MSRLWIFIVGIVLLGLPALADADNWPQFRGPNGTGVGTESSLPSEWAADKNVKWKVAVPGIAWSSPIVWGEKVLVTTAIADKQPRPTPGMGAGGGFGGGGGTFPKFDPKKGKGGFGKGGFGKGGFGKGAKAPDAVYRWEVHCYDRTNGKLLWKQLAAEQKPLLATHGKNTFASETPVTDGERVYAFFGPTGLFCFDLTGTLVWKKELPRYSMQFGFGTGASPTLHDGRLFLQCDNEDESFLAAFEAKTGKELWRVKREEKSSWGTPFVWKNKQRTELVTAGGLWARSYDPATGKQLWQLGGMSFSSNSTPVADNEQLYIGSGGSFGGRPLFAVRAGATGDITLKDGESSSEFVAWSKPQAGPTMASPLLYDGYLYILSDRGGMLSCLEARTGKVMYDRQRIPQASSGYTASPWAYGGKIFCLGEDGKCSVIQAGPEFKVLGTNKLDEMFMATPALAGGALILRGIDHLYCVQPR